ncbi:protein kinase domain-containing protein [Hydrocarboniphaga effusa]|uniref:serine/threonine-protein kinase n=1 Tax=Hydrocarboniphaga effusa TaxID=243629 RepID=UPI00398C210D
MDAARWARLEALFDEAIELGADERARYLAELGVNEPELHAELVRLLAAADAPSARFDAPAVDALRPAAMRTVRDAAGQQIGAWKLVERIGSGGSGEVYRAERADGRYAQTVAVKLLRREAIDTLPRFEAEQRILARLEHPGIARLYDAGITDDGRPYTVMEWVEGTDLTRWCLEHEAGLPTRLALFLQICAAVSWAHRHLLVHRDLKPANLRVTPDGQVKLLDFGIAKQLDDDATQTLNAPLTLAYAAPEQLRGEAATTATDVYALGVILFELLTGRVPWAGDGGSLAAAARRLLDAPVPLPSRASRADTSPVPRAQLRGDLDAIVARALRAEPDARYVDARELADDLRRHLEHEPVLARSGSRSYVLRRSLRRHWLAWSAAATVFVTMAAAIGGIGWQARKARIEARRAAAVQDFMVDLFRTNSSRQADPVKARQTTARELLDIGARRIETGLDEAPQNKLALLRLFGGLYGEFALSSEQLPVRKQAVELSRRLFGDDSPELASDLVALARAIGAHDEAERLIAQAGAILDRRRDERSFVRGQQLLASAINNESSDPEGAQNDARRAAAILQNFADSAELAEAHYIVGITLCSQGDYGAAIEPLKQAITVSISALGVPNPKLSQYYEQLGNAQGFTLRYAEAEASIAQAIEQAHENKAEYDYDRVRALTTMAVVLFNEDQPRRSLEFAERAKADAPPASEGSDAALLRAYVFDTASRSALAAGDFDGALADAQVAVQLARIHDPEGVVLVSALQRKAAALEELGRIGEAAGTAQEAFDVLARLRPEPSRLTTWLQIGLALDLGRLDQARTLFATLPPGGADTQTVTPKAQSRNLFAARINLAASDYAGAIRLAAAAIEQSRASRQAPYLRLEIADGQLVEALARLRGGDAAGARGLLADALATRTELYLPQHPKIAEARLALAECALALGRRTEAAGLIAQAAAIEQRHSSLSVRYREPLTRLRRQIAMR